MKNINVYYIIKSKISLKRVTAVRKYDITALGEILIDFVPDGVDSVGDMRFIRKAGGAPLNVLATAARAGLKTAFIGKVGNDLPGEFLIETVKGCGIDCNYLKKDTEHNTTLAFVELDNKGDRKFSFYRTYGADRFIYESDVDKKLIADSKVFHFGSLSLTDEPSYFSTEIAVKTAKDCGCTVTYDPNYRPPLWDSPEKAAERMAVLLPYVDIIKLSVEELEMISKGRGTEFLFEKGVRLALVTDGDKGATLCFKGEKAHIPAIKAKTVDTTGAGDIFLGTFVSEFIKKGENLDELSFDDAINFTQKAVFISGKSTEKYGAIASISDVII